MRHRYVLAQRRRDGHFIDEVFATDSERVWRLHTAIHNACSWIVYALASIVSSPVEGDEVRREHYER